MHILVVDNGTKHLARLRKLLKAHRVTVWRYSRIRIAELSKFDAVILSGGKTFPVLGYESRLKNELALIHSFRKPILGICFGFELIAHAFGSTLKRLKVKERGILTIRVTRPNSFFGRDKRVRVFEGHRWVVQNPGKQLRVLAVSKDGIEAIQHNTRPIVGVQFHPEMFTNKKRGAAFFNTFLNAFHALSPRARKTHKR
jgi:GMP synthase-like glutamine amidotransferase